ncbi:hypothetical protein STEG23_006876 [Scotinomys teguina]
MGGRGSSQSEAVSSEEKRQPAMKKTRCSSYRYKQKGRYQSTVRCSERDCTGSDTLPQVFNRSKIHMCVLTGLYEEVLEIATKPVNYMEIHGERHFKQQNNKGEESDLHVVNYIHGSTVEIVLDLKYAIFSILLAETDNQLSNNVTETYYYECSALA